MRWLPRPVLTRAIPLRARAPAQLRRSSSVADFRVDEVPCGSSGSVPISLYNTAQTSLPLLIYIPPFPTPPPSPDYLPPLLRPYPTAVIHYRWSPSSSLGPITTLPTPHHWPTPLHDISFAYAHLTTTLAPPLPTRRAIYLLSSHLGAPLATSLALTESHPHRAFAVRGLAVHNGVYNWTMFLADHPAHRPARRRPPKTKRTRQRDGGNPAAEPDRYGCRAIREMEEMMPGLFAKTDNLFDPFASPSLFFRTAGLNIPSSFTASETFASQIDHLASASENPDPTPPETTTPPRRAALIFPPRDSTLKIPETHFLYTRTSGGKRPKRRGNTFESQALALAEVMRMSVEREVRERMSWDNEVGGDVSGLRVRTHDLGAEDSAGMGAAEGVLAGWLKEKFGF